MPANIRWDLIRVLKVELDIHVSVHHDTVYENDQQDATV
jgi:hypothetical protein